MRQLLLGFGQQPPGFQGRGNGFPLAHAVARDGVEGCKQKVFDALATHSVPPISNIPSLLSTRPETARRPLLGKCLIP